MPWVKQTAVSTTNPRNLSRTDWLAPLSGAIRAAIESYFAEQPEGEEVTLAVFDAIDMAALEDVIAHRDEDAARRELGLRVPIELVAMYGAERVETLRKKDLRGAAPRRAHRDWPRNYTPHRVLPVREELGLKTDIRMGSEFESVQLWRRIFEAWFGVLSDYRRAGEDQGWWHCEAASVSQLAGAMWRLGGVGISEYGVKRRGGDRPGRADSWFALDRHSVDLECKQVWPTTADDFAGRLVQERLAEAAWQLGRVHRRDRSPYRFAVCFVVPAVEGPAKDADKVLDAVEAVVEDEVTALARYRPKGDKLAKRRWDGFRYPAVMLVVRRVV